MKNSSTNIAQGKLTSTSILHFPSWYLWKATFGPLHLYLKDRGMWWPSSFQVEDHLGYWLFYAQRSVAHAFYEALKVCCIEHNKPYVVTPPQWGVLSLLHEQDGQTIGTLSQKRAIDAPTMTGIVKRLEQNGLVERIHDREDRRLVKIYLTDEGRDIMRFLPDAAIKFSKIMAQGFSEDEQCDLQAKLQRIIANLSNVGPGTGDRFGLLPDFIGQAQQGE
jgi:DNA-binding MarR family transcriptional regulator